MTTDLNTEKRLAEHLWLDRLDTASAIAVMLDNQAEAIVAIKAVLREIEQAIKLAHQRLSASDDARLIYAGAGTSARIAVQDGSELLPTFDWPAGRVDYLIAGGPEALMRPVENAEDKSQAALQATENCALMPRDVVICLAASGTTPFTCKVAETARKKGALTIGIANNRHTPLLELSECGICLDTGPEAVAGSTRLKAGTAQKICLNMISTQLMILSGRVQDGLMVAMQPRNAKLKQRHEQIKALLCDDKKTAP